MGVDSRTPGLRPELLGNSGLRRDANRIPLTKPNTKHNETSLYQWMISFSVTYLQTHSRAATSDARTDDHQHQATRFHKRAFFGATLL